MDFGRILGQRRAFAAVAGRCSAAHAQLLRRIRDEKLFFPIAPSWRAFCGAHLAITRRHADRLIALLNRFGPIYFEISELIGLSPRQYLAIEPALREQGIVLNGEAISLLPENAPKVLEAVGQLLRETAATSPPLANRNLRERVIDVTNRCRQLARNWPHSTSRLHPPRQLLRRIRDENTLTSRSRRPGAPSAVLTFAITRRHADRLIALLNRFGPIYFEISELIGLSPRQYPAIEPALREQGLVVESRSHQPDP